MSAILGGVEGFQTLRVTNIRCGSLIIDFEVIVDISSDTTVTDVANTIDLAAGSDGNIGNQIYIITNQAGEKLLRLLTECVIQVGCAM